MDNANIWKVASGVPEIADKAWNEFLSDNFVAIGNWFEDLGQDIDYSTFKTKEELLEELEKVDYSEGAASSIWHFVHDMQVGDIVVVNHGMKQCRGIGIITSDYMPPQEANPDYEMRNIRKVKWIVTNETTLSKNFFPVVTVTPINNKDWNEIVATYCSNHPDIRYNLLKNLFDDFYKNYFEKENIREEYERLSNEYLKCYRDILKKKENNQEYWDDVWLNLISHDDCPYLPYKDSKSHFEQIGYGSESLRNIAISVFDLVDKLVTSPKEDFTQQKLAIIKSNIYNFEGIQDGIISPIFFLINPYYYIINPRMVESFKFLRYFIKNTDSINKDLTDYIDNNLKLHELVKSFGEIIPQLGNFVVFNAFSTWLNNKKLGGGYASGKALPLELLDEYPPISTNEWISILKNDILDSKMIKILKIIYESDNHAATTGEIRSIRASLGFKNEKSYNSIIVANSKKVKEFLNDKTILNEDGSEEYWSRFFDGEKVNGTFRFQIKKELVKAFEIMGVVNIPKEKSFYKYLSDKGFYFDKETIENYLLSLKVKPFIILTGNSGTGKTKLSQLFANYMQQFIDKSSNYPNELKFADSDSTDDNIDYDNLDYIDTEVTIGKSAKNKGWTVTRHDFDDIIPIDIIEGEYPIIVDGVESSGRLNLNVRVFYKNDKKSDLKKHLTELTNSNVENAKLRLFYDKEKLVKEIINYYEVEPEFQDTDLSKIIPVGANWTENRNILGYYNVITEEYQTTPSYELIKTAQRNITNPYFLILDEMNLSHVERYFADFLSAIESGEPIPLYGNDEDLEIPDNLFIVGTVNVDETTYMFSPKVLDRANTIEFETYSSKDYMLGRFNSTPPSGNIEYLENPLLDSEIREMDINQLKDLFEDIGSDFWETLSEEIFKFQKILKKSGFDFGFRVINEIIRFMYVAWVYEGKPENWDNWERYFDAQIKQKMLPKLHGSERAIGETLDDLYNACFLDDSSRRLPVDTSFKYPKSAAKLEEMKEVLNKQRYVSFIN